MHNPHGFPRMFRQNHNIANNTSQTTQTTAIFHYSPPFFHTITQRLPYKNSASPLHTLLDIDNRSVGQPPKKTAICRTPNSNTPSCTTPFGTYLTACSLHLYCAYATFQFTGFISLATLPSTSCLSSVQTIILLLIRWIAVPF
jgi:hypothetical protein